MKIDSIAMKKQYDVQIGTIESAPFYQINLNINHLQKGIYTLKIIHKNKVIKKTTFKK